MARNLPVNKRVIKTILLYIVSFTIFFLLLKSIEFNRIIDVFRSVDLIYIIIVCILSIFSVLLGGINIWLLIYPLKKVGVKRIMGHYLASWSLSMFLPSRIGEFFIIHLLKDDLGRLGEATAVFVLDKIITTSMMVISAIITLALFFPPIYASITSLALIIFLSLIIASFYLPSSKRFIKRFILRKHTNLFDGFSKSSIELFFKHWKFIILNSAGTLLRYCVMTLIIYLTFIGLGFNINMFYIFLFFVTSQLFSLVPFTMNGLGLREVMFVYLYDKIDITPEVTVSRSIINLVIMYSYSIISLFILRKSRFMKDVKSRD